MRGASLRLYDIDGMTRTFIEGLFRKCKECGNIKLPKLKITIEAVE